MKIVNAYMSRDGQLHKDKQRAAASDLHHALPKKFSDSNSKVLDWNHCLAVVSNREIIQKVFDELDATGCPTKHDPNE